MPAPRTGGLGLPAQRGAPARGRHRPGSSRRRHRHSAAPPSPFSRCFSTDGEGIQRNDSLADSCPDRCIVCFPCLAVQRGGLGRVEQHDAIRIVTQSGLPGAVTRGSASLLLAPQFLPADPSTLLPRLLRAPLQNCNNEHRRGGAAAYQQRPWHPTGPSR